MIVEVKQIKKDLNKNNSELEIIAQRAMKDEKKRIKECSKCDQLTKIYTCKQCGCYMKAKVKFDQCSKLKGARVTIKWQTKNLLAI